MPNFLDRLTIPEESGLDPTMLVPLLRLLAAGEPVTVEALAAAVGLPVDEVTRRLAAVPDTEYDEQGRIVGQGLTLRPTRHRFTVAGQELYTWCALDTLIFPTILDRPASIESESPVSGHPMGLGRRKRCHQRAARDRGGLAGQPRRPHLDPVLILQPGALLHLRAGRRAVARRAPRRSDRQRR